MKVQKFLNFELKEERLILALSIVIILPFIVISFFSYPSADDYCRILPEGASYFKRVIAWYNNHNGRFSNAILGYLQVYNPIIYWIFPILSMLSVWGGLHYFFKELFKAFKLEIKQIKIVSISFFAFFMLTIPHHSELFYWYATATAYGLSFGILLLLMGLFLKLIHRASWTISFLIGSLIFIVNGNHEMIMMACNLLSGLLLLYALLKKDKTLIFQALTILAFSFGSSLMVILSPGSLHRQDLEDTNQRSIVEALMLAISFGGTKIYQFIVSVPKITFILCFSVLLLKLNQKNKADKAQTINSTILFIISALFLIGIALVPCYALGERFTNSRRIINLYQLLIAVVFVINWINFIYRSSLIEKLNSKHIFPIAFALFACFSLFRNPSYTNVIADLVQGKALAYRTSLTNRELLVQKTDQEHLIVPHNPKAITISKLELKPFPKHWVNSCYRDMLNIWNKTSVRTIVSNNSLVSYDYKAVKVLAEFDSINHVQFDETGVATYYDKGNNYLIFMSKEEELAPQSERFLVWAFPTKNKFLPKGQKHGFKCLDFEWTPCETPLYTLKYKGLYFYFKELPDFPLRKLRVGQYWKEEGGPFIDIWKKNISAEKSRFFQTYDEHLAKN